MIRLNIANPLRESLNDLGLSLRAQLSHINDLILIHGVPSDQKSPAGPLFAGNILDRGVDLLHVEGDFEPVSLEIFHRCTELFVGILVREVLRLRLLE